MATLHPSNYTIDPRHRSHSRSRDTLRPRSQESRTRSRSRAPAKLYNPDSPKRYGANEARPRKPPLSPKIEDERFEDDGVKMRGKLEQQPMIIALNGHDDALPIGTSRTTNTEPMTPPSSEESFSEGSEDDSESERQQERRQQGHHGRNAHEERQSVNTGLPHEPVIKSRPDLRQPQARSDSQADGRHLHRKPDLEPMSGREASQGENPPHIERARSPYAHAPQVQAQNVRPLPRHYSTDGLLSPTGSGPTVHDMGDRRPSSQRPSQSHPNEEMRNGKVDTAKFNPQMRAHPTLSKRSSATPLSLGRSTPPGSPLQSRPKQDLRYSPEEVESSPAGRHTKADHKASYFDSQQPQRDEYRRDSRIQTSPPHTPATEQHKWGQSLNREALLNGAAAALTSHSLRDSQSRRASPRPSPLASPASSPYPSPPGTPPEISKQQRSPAIDLKHGSLSERPSSSPSLGPSSPKMANHGGLKSHVGDSQERQAREPRYMPRSRATSPLPMTRQPEPETPKIDVRSPSPMPPAHSKSTSHETNEVRIPSRYVPTYATSAATLQPGRPGMQRQRSVSNVERSGSRPDLTIVPPLINQQDVQYLSPTAEQTPSHFRTDLKVSSRPSLLSPTTRDSYDRNSDGFTSASNRSRSSAPTQNAQTQRSNSAMPVPISRHRSRSSAPAPQLPYSDQRPLPALLPQCPRPKPLAGKKDWYTLNGCDSLAICPDCRHDIFGSGFSSAIKRRSPPPPDEEIHCNLNDPWMRMACIASIGSGRRDLSLPVELALETEDRTACPKVIPAVRDWYYLRDEEAQKDLIDFRVCSHCVYSMYTLFPALEGVFARHDEPDEDEPLLCSIRSADPVRFATYVDHCEKAAADASRHANKRKPDMSDLSWYHKKETVIADCPQNQVLIGQDWHLHALIPNFTICEDCFYNTVRPAIKKKQPLAEMFNRDSKHISDPVSCMLYSPRMREIFERACEEDDEKYLRSAVKLRRDLQKDIEEAREEVLAKPRDRGRQRDLDDLMEDWRRLEKKKY